ncbi:MAG: transaldolase [Telmatospirillum sp.]|nr:transaldolase [Telmatospirillum sp.]
MNRPNDLRVRLFADGADLGGIRKLADNPLIAGFTTNPTLMRKAGVTDYEGFSREVLSIAAPRSVSLEVFADELAEIERQAEQIAGWGDNVYVKIPVTTTSGESTGSVVSRLSARGIKVNVTALMTTTQVAQVCAALDPKTPAFVSVFAGRIADTGRDPLPIMRESVEILKTRPRAELIWASPRELLNIVHAEQVGCHIITATNDLLAKLPIWGKDLDVFSLETVKMFRSDALAAGYRLAAPAATPKP